MSRLASLSDADLDILYYNAKGGGEKGNWSEDDDGYDEGGWTSLDVYTGQISDYSKGNQAEHDRIDKLSKLYSENVFHDYEGGRLLEDEKRQGFESIFKEKERRRQAQATPAPAPAPAPAPEPKKPTQKIGPVKYSAEIENAQNTVNDYQSPYKLHDVYKGEFQGFPQNETDFTTQFNFGGDRMNAGQSDEQSADQQPTPQQNQAQQLADNYKLNLISSGATKGQSKQFEYANTSKYNANSN